MRITLKSRMLAIVAGVIASGAAMAQTLPTHASVNFTTGSPTGTWFPVAATVAEITNANYQNHPISVTPSAGGVGNALTVGSGQADIGISYAPFLKLAQQGNNNMYKPSFPKLRAISAMVANALHIVVSDKMNFGEVIKSKKPINLATGPTGSTELFTMQEVLAGYGGSVDSVRSGGGRVELLNTAGRSDGWSNRQFDVVNFFINPPAAGVIALMAKRPDSRILSIDPAIAKKISDQWGMLEVRIPPGTYPNQNEEVITLGMPYVYFTTADADEQLIYNMTKAIAENKTRLTNTQSSFKDWQPENMPKGLGIELHPGAAKYYRERGWIN